MPALGLFETACAMETCDASSCVGPSCTSSSSFSVVRVKWLGTHGTAAGSACTTLSPVSGNALRRKRALAYTSCVDLIQDPLFHGLWLAGG